MGTEERREMLFWTREEYTRFSEAMMDKPISLFMPLRCFTGAESGKASCWH